MTGPIRGDWASRPGWSEFGAWRAAGKHTGFDYYCPEGTHVYATATGVVTLAGWNGSTNGYQVTIRHDGGQATSFSCHLLADIRVTVGQSVTRDTVVGFVGHSGNARDIYWKTEWHGATTDLRHVHHTVKADGRLVDPILFYGPSPAGGGTTPINQQEEDDDMALSFITNDGTGPWFVTDGLTKRPLAPGEDQLLKDLGLKLTGEAAEGKVKLLGNSVDLIPDAVRVVAPDPAAIAKALAPLLKVGASIADIETALADNFAAIPGAVRAAIVKE